MAVSTALGGAWLVMENGKAKRKPKRIVKHKKKAWRVTSVEDVERFLESKRLDERLGAPFSERPSESLFVLDTQQSSQPEEPKKPRKLKEIGELKCFSILKPSSAVPDPLIKRNRVRLPEERGDPRVRKIMEERRAKGKIPTRFLNSMRDHQKKVEELAKKKKPERLRSTFDFDMWGQKGDTIMIGDKEVFAADLSDEVKTYTLEKTGSRVYSRPRTMFTKTTSLAAVEVPHPGASYNPTFDDHQSLLRKAYDVQVKEMVQEAKVRRQLGPMTLVTNRQKEVNWMTEMSQGLAEDDEQDAEANEEAPCVRQPRPKTRKQKLKAKALRLLEMRRKRLKEAKKRLLQVDRLRSINREIHQDEKQMQSRAEKRQKKKEAKLSQPAVLGRYKYQEPDVEVNLSEEIAGSLRGLKTEGDILIDRYKSLQKRNIIEPRIKQRVILKYKRKRFNKRSHVEPTGVRIGRST